MSPSIPVVEPEANLVARSRLRLEEALDALPPKRWYERIGQYILNNVASLQAAPVAAILLLIVGAGAGSLGGYEFAQGRMAHVAGRAQAAEPASAQPQPVATSPAEIASISSIVRQPNSEMVEVRYNQFVPQRIRGIAGRPGHPPVADAGIRERRLRRGCATTLSGCWRLSAAPGTVARRRAFRDALMVALRYDKNEGVREKALEGLAAIRG